jgi:hypothetical protein
MSANIESYIKKKTALNRSHTSSYIINKNPYSKQCFEKLLFSDYKQEYLFQFIGISEI